MPHRLLRRLAAGRVGDGLAAKAGVWQRRSTLRRTVREPDRRHLPPRISFRRRVGRAAFRHVHVASRRRVRAGAVAGVAASLAVIGGLPFYA